MGKNITEYDLGTHLVGGLQIKDSLRLKGVKLATPFSELNKLNGLDVESEDLNKIKDLDVTSEEINMLVHDYGSFAYQTLHVSGVVADEDWVEIGDDKYEVVQVNSDTAKTTVGSIDDETKIITIEASDDAHTVDAGDVILVGDTELMLALSVEGEFITALREWGTAMETHVEGATIYKGTAYTAGNIPVGMVKEVLDADDFLDHLELVSETALENQELTGIDVEEEHIELVKISSARMLAKTKEPISDDTVVDDDGTNIDWVGATLVGGYAPEITSITVLEHTVTTDEGTANLVVIPVVGEPKQMLAQVRDTDGAVIAWNGKLSYESSGSYLQLNNDGDTNFAATNVIKIIILV